MRITIHLPASLLRKARVVASQAKIELSDLIADAIRSELLRRRRLSQTRINLPVFTPPPGKEGVHPGVDLDNTGALLDLMDEADGVFDHFRPKQRSKESGVEPPQSKE